MEEGDRLMRYWLFKSEPSTWSWDQQKAKGKAGEEWDGVRNYQARNNMREMEVGDRGFFYHSQTEKAVVGIVEVIAEAHPDSTTDDERWECVDIKAVSDMSTPVTLEMAKGDPRLSDMILVNNSRLSVQPVTEAEWRVVCELGGLKSCRHGPARERVPDEVAILPARIRTLECRGGPGDARNPLSPTSASHRASASSGIGPGHTGQ